MSRRSAKRDNDEEPLTILCMTLGDAVFAGSQYRLHVDEVLEEDAFIADSCPPVPEFPRKNLQTLTPETVLETLLHGLSARGSCARISSVASITARRCERRHDVWREGLGAVSSTSTGLEGVTVTSRIVGHII